MCYYDILFEYRANTSFQLDIKSSHSYSHCLQRTQRMLNCQLKDTVWFFLELKIAIVRVVIVCKHEVFRWVISLILPMLKVVELNIDLFFEISKIDVTLLIAKSKLIACVHWWQKNSESSLTFIFFHFWIPNNHVNNRQIELSNLYWKIKHPISIVVDVRMHYW